jgi:adenylate kinase
MKVIIVTGTPGTGKSFISRQMAKKLGYSHIELSKFVKERRLFDRFDKASKSYVVDEKKLVAALKRYFKNHLSKGFIVDGHMSHFLPTKIVNKAIVCKSPLKVIKSRLKARHYSKSKIRENLDAEIFNVCYEEALEAGHKPIVFDGKNLPSLLKRLRL